MQKQREKALLFCVSCFFVLFFFLVLVLVLFCFVCFLTECLIHVLFLDVTTRLTHGRALHRILCKAWHPVDLLYHNVPSMSSLSTLQVPFSFFSPGVYREMDQHSVHEKLAILSAPSCSTKQDEHFHELLVVYLKAIRRGVLTLLSVTKCPYTLFVNFTITSSEKFKQWRS